MISIIIPTLGRATLENLLESIKRAASAEKTKPGFDFEIVISFDPRANLQELHWEKSFGTTLVSSPKVGVNHARNAGGRRSRGAVLWFLDDDVELVGGGCFGALKEIFADADVLAAGGEYVTKADAGLFERGYNALCSLWRSSAGVENREQLLGGTLAVRRVAWEELGGFDEQIEYGGAETAFVDLLHRSLDVAPQCTKVSFDQALDVVHSPGTRGIRGWVKVAYLQGRQKKSGKTKLPTLSHRVRRSASYLRSQNARTLIALVVFSIPFITVSQLGVRSAASPDD